jgi:hypothetical protein
VDAYAPLSASFSNQAGGATGLAQQLEHVARVPGAQRRRRPEHHRAQDVGDALHHRLELRHDRRVLRRHARQRLARLGLVVVEEDRRAVGGEGPERRVERDRVVAEALEFEVLDDLRAEHRHHVRRARHPPAGRDLLGHAGAAEQVAALEHADPQAGAGQIRGGGEAVVAAADDDRVEVRVMAVAGTHRRASR